MPVVVGVLVVSLHHEAVVCELQSLFERPFADHLDGEAVQFPNRFVQSARSGVLGYLLQTLPDNLLVGGVHAVHPDRIQPVSILVCPGSGKEPVPVLCHGFNGRRVAAQFPGLGLQFELRLAPVLVERLALSLQRSNSLFELRLVQQICIPGENSHVLREVHARFLVHRPLVDGTCTHRAAFQLRDEHLLAVQQVEFVAVQRLFHRIDDDIHIVAGKMLGNLVARTHTTPVTLLQVGRAPRRIKMMDRHAPFLCVHARSEHTRGAEEHTHRPGIHGIYHRLACLVGLALLNEADFAGRYAVVLRQLPLYLAVHVPPFTWLIRPQVREYELRAFLCVVSVVILRYHLGAVARLVVGVVFVVRVYHAHIQCHLAGVIGGDEHLRLLLRFRQRQSAQQCRIARFGKFHQLLDEILLVGRGRYVVQYLVLVRTVHAHILRRAVVSDFVVEGGKLRHLDEVAETLLLHDVVRHVELEVSGFLGENRRPRIEAADVLPLQLFRTQVLEEQVQLRQRVADGRARKERSPQVLARPLLYGADGKEHVQGFLASFRVSQPRHTVMPGVESQVLKLVRFVNEDVVDAHLLEIRHIVRA